MDLDTFIKDHVLSSTQQKCFFHFTDTRNLSLIRQYGLYSSLLLNQKGLVVPQVGGNELSLQLDKECGMDKFVHLCFRANHSMEHMAKNDGRIQESVFLHIDPSVIKLKGVLLTDDVSNQKNVVPAPAASALDKLDLEIIYKRTEWSKPEFLSRLKIAERYEILIPDHIPTKYILKGI